MHVTRFNLRDYTATYDVVSGGGLFLHINCTALAVHHHLVSATIGYSMCCYISWTNVNHRMDSCEVWGLLAPGMLLAVTYAYVEYVTEASSSNSCSS